MITANQRAEIFKIIEDQTSILVGSTLGPNYLSDDDKKRLKSIGVDADALYKASEDPILLNFQLGMLSATLSKATVDKLTFPELKRMVYQGKGIELNAQEKAVISSVKNQTLSDIRSKQGEIFRDFNSVVQTVSDSTRKNQEEFIKNHIEGGLRDRKNVNEIARELHRKTGDWSRNFNRIVQYVSHKAFTEGRVALMKRKGGDKVKVYVNVLETACSYCNKLYLTNGKGSRPKVFEIDKLEANGTNIGKKIADWLPVLPPAHPHCYDDKTEVLTDLGWKFFKDLDKTEKFLSVDLNTGRGEWIKAVGWIDQEYQGPMVSWENKNNSLLTTPNHNHIFTTYHTKNKRLRLAPTDKLSKEAKLLKHLPLWIGKSVKFIEFGEMVFDAEDFFEFMGYFISEGSLINYKGGWRINISQQKEHIKKHILDNARKLFSTVSSNKGYVQVYLGKNQRFEELIKYLSLGKSHEKFIPSNIKESNPHLIEIFLSAFNKGDGSIRRGSDWDGYISKDQRLFYTSSKRLADDLGELILKTRNTPSYKYREPQEIFDPQRNKSYKQNNGIWIVTETRNKYAFRPNLNEKIVDYDGRIYDVELEKNHTLFVRRNGKVLVSGNCRCHTIEYNEGEWSGSEFVIKKDYETKLNRAKVRIKVGEKEYFV